jgi:hypothetical protein
MVDQLVTSQLSHVGFRELAKETSDCKRMTLTTVTLFGGQSSNLGQARPCHGKETMVDSQGADEEHDGHANLLLPVQL